MVVHQDDYVELTLIHRTQHAAHNIDFHSATGALGGGALTVVNPGETTVLRFRATKAGVFVYTAHLPACSVARHVRDERRDHGAAARRTDRRQRQVDYL